jgi:hypothetical protein
MTPSNSGLEKSLMSCVAVVDGSNEDTRDGMDDGNGMVAALVDGDDEKVRWFEWSDDGRSEDGSEAVKSRKAE